MRRLPLSLLLLAFACNQADTRQIEPPVGSQADAAEGTEDAETSDGPRIGEDAAPLGDAGEDPDAGEVEDAGAARDGGASDGGGLMSDASTSDPCAELLDCCVTLPVGQMQCEDVANMGDPMRCEAVLDQLVSRNLCESATDAGPAPDVGPIPDTGPPSGACAELLDCCGTLPVGQSQCEGVAYGNDQAQCQSVLDTLRGRGICEDPDAGADGGRPGRDSGSVLDGGPAPDGGSITDGGLITDGGPTGDGGLVCAELAACCPQLPQGQANCASTAAAGDEAVCQRALAGARRLGYCLADAGP